MLLIAVPAYQAYRRGYNPFVWATAAVLALNPIFVLSCSQCRRTGSRQQLREVFRRELDKKLNAAGLLVVPGLATSPLIRTERIDTHSVGDQVTQIPDRSIGDDQTRL